MPHFPSRLVSFPFYSDSDTVRNARLSHS
jgi:hypothetical protein